MPKNPSEAENMTPDQNPDNSKQSGVQPAQHRPEVDRFLYTESVPPKTMRSEEGFIAEPQHISIEIEDRVNAVTLPRETHVTAEDALTPGFEGLTAIFDKNEIRFPDTLHIYSGEKAEATEEISFENEKVSVISTPSDEATNSNGVVVHYDEIDKALRIVLAHGPQYDSFSGAHLANVVALKGAVELTTHSTETPSEIVERIDADLNLAKKELGVDKPVDYSFVELKRGLMPDVYHLSFGGRGNNSCVIISEEGQVDQEVLGDLEGIIKPDQIDKVYAKMESLTTPEAIEKRLQSMAEDVPAESERISRVRDKMLATAAMADVKARRFVAILNEALTPSQAYALNTWVIDSMEQGMKTEQIKDIVKEYFRKEPVVGKNVSSGDVVIIATPEVEKLLKDQKLSIGSKFFLELKNGRDLSSISAEIMGSLLDAQKAEKYPSESASIVAFKVPEFPLSMPEQATLDQQMDAYWKGRESDVAPATLKEFESLPPEEAIKKLFGF